MVRFTQYPSLHDPRFCQAVHRDGDPHREKRRTRPPRPPLYARPARLARQSAGRARRLRTEPGSHVMIVAQITDMHILAAGKLFHSPRATIPADDPTWSHIDTAAHLARAVAQLNALTPMPDITVITGDLTDHGGVEEYANLRTLLAPLRMP